MDSTPPKRVRHVYQLTGMTCAGCARRVERALSGVDGVYEVRTSFLFSEVAVYATPEVAQGEEIVSAIEAIGLGATPGRRRPLDQEASCTPLLRAWVLAVPVLVFAGLRGAGLWTPAYGDWLELLLALPVLAIAGRETIARGIAALRANAADLNTLVAVGALLAFSTGPLRLAGADTASFVPIAAVIIASHLTGRYFEMRGRVGIAEGLRHPTSISDEIIDTVCDAQFSQPQVQETARQMTGLLVYVALGTALGTALMWVVLPELPLALGGWAAPWLPWSPAADESRLTRGIFAALAVLLAAAPCAVVLATPAAVAGGTVAAVSRGLLVRSGVAMQRARELSILCFGKTGTLTRGRPRVVSVEALHGTDGRDVLTWAAAAALFSAHPVARAIVEHAIHERCAALPASDVVASTGGGMQATVDGAIVHIGTPAYLAAAGVETAALEHAVYRLQREAKTVVAVSRSRKVVGLIALTDDLRPESVRAVRVLKRMGIQCVLISGASQGTAEVVADQCGIPRVLAGVRPEDKAKAVARLKKETIGAVGMVGDGIEDAGALAAADLGVVFANAGPAVESGAIVVLEGDFTASLTAIQLCRATYHKALQNLGWAVVYNMLFILLAMLGLLHPILAQAAMTGSTLLVYGNARRLGRFDPEKVARETMRR